MTWILLSSGALTYGEHSSCALSFMYLFTNHLFLYILSENGSCWNRNRQHLADSEHQTNMCK